jgi:hypothetical protein
VRPGQQLVQLRLAGQLIEEGRVGPAPRQRVHRGDGQGQPGGPPVGREVDHGGRLARGEEHVPAEVAVDQLGGQAHRPERRQQAPQLPGQRPGRRCQDAPRIALAPRDLVPDRPLAAVPAQPGRRGPAGQRGVERPARLDQPGPGRGDAGPGGGFAGQPLPGHPGAGQRVLGHPVPGGRAERPRHAEAGVGAGGQGTQIAVQVGGPARDPRVAGRLEHELSGPPGGALAAGQRHGIGAGAEGSQHCRTRAHTGSL